MSDESLRRAGRAELDRLNAGSKAADAQTPPKAKKKRIQSDLRSVFPRGRETRVGEKGETVSDVVDRAVNGAKLSY